MLQSLIVPQAEGACRTICLIGIVSVLKDHRPVAAQSRMTYFQAAYIYIDVDCRSFKAAAAKYKRMHGLEQQQTEAEDRCEHPFLMQC